MTTTLTHASTRAARHPGWLERRCRSALLAGMQTLREGQLTLSDADGDHRAGTPAPDGIGGVVHVHDPRLYTRMTTAGVLGAAEAYIDGDWTSDDLVALLRVFARQVEATEHTGGWTARLGERAAGLLHRLRHNSRRGAKANIAAHYDLGDDFFSLWLDPSLTYSAAIYPTPTASLAEAQTFKLDRICQTLELRRSDHLLEIGTGWGALAIHAARHYGCRVTTTTISAAQHACAARRVAEAGLGDRITLLQQDYRDLGGAFDKLVSIEMIEAVGHQYLGSYLRTCADRLAPDGAALIQMIAMPERRYAAHRHSRDFIQRYIFPGSCLPSLGALTTELTRCDLRVARVEEFTPHYARTLGDWRTAFLARRDEVLALGPYDEAFCRCWDYYLAYCQAAFAERAIASQQVLLVKPRSTVGLRPLDVPHPPAVQ